MVVGATGTAATLSESAFAALPRPPTISATQARFTIPDGTTSSWTLKLWSHGSLEGTDVAMSGTLIVAVPTTSDCTFQADVSVTPAGGKSMFYSGARATVPGCGPPPSPSSTIAGDIFLCSATGQTRTEVGGGTLAATGPESVPTGTNPLAPTKVLSGSYMMTASSPSGFGFVTCQGSASVASTGLTASVPVFVPAGGAGLGTFYVVATVPTGSLSGGSTVGPATSPSSVTHHTQPVGATQTSGSHLAFTGMNTAAPLLAGLVALALGTASILISLARRRKVGTRPVDLLGQSVDD